MPESAKDRAPGSNKASTRGDHRRRVRVAMLLAFAAILLTGCAPQEPPGPTEEEIAARDAEEAAAKAAEEAAARAAVETLVSDTETRLSQILGVADAKVTLQDATAAAEYPVEVRVSFMPDVAGSVLVEAAADLWPALTADGLTVVALDLDLPITPRIKHEGRWMTDGLGPQTEREIQLWARVVAAKPGYIVALTNDSAEPFSLRVFFIPSAAVPPTSGVVYREIVDICVELGIDPASAKMLVQASWYDVRAETAVVPPELLAAAEIAELQQTAILNSVRATPDGFAVYFEARMENGSKVYIGPAAQDALLGPFRDLGVLDDRLEVNFLGEGSTQAVWPRP